MGTAALDRADVAAPQALVGQSVVLPLGSFALGVLTLAVLAGGRVPGNDPAVVVLAACLAFPAAAAVLLDRMPDHPLGTALCAPALVPLVGALAAWPGGGDRPLPAQALTSSAVPAALLVAVVLVALPLLLSRHPLQGSSAWVAGAAGAAVLLSAASAAVTGRTPELGRTTVLPDGAGGPASLVVLAGAVVAAHVIVLLRWSRAVGVERVRSGWYLVGVSVLLPCAAALVGWILQDGPPLAYYTAGAVLLVLPVAVLALVLTPAPPALDRALARVTASVLLTLLLAAVYVAAVAGLAATGLPDGPQGAAVLTATAALVAVPLWGRCREALETRLFGAGRSPAQVLAALHAQLMTDDADPVRAITGWVAAAVRSPAVTLVGEMPDTAAQDAAALVVPLQAGGTALGHLVVAPRRPGERYSSRDRRVLEQLAVPVGLVVRTAAANEQLARSEQRLAEERSRERRRVLDDLHDDLGPALAGIGMQLSVARTRLTQHAGAGTGARRPEGVALLDSAVVATERAGLVMRRLVRELGGAGTPAASARALGPALAELARGWSAAAGDTGLQVELADVDGLPQLPRPVEETAYRIAGEAVTNVVRHAGATHCTLRAQATAAADGHVELVVQVEDDGRTTGPWSPGVGLRSMQERAAALGGTVVVAATPGGGTVLTARLPLPRGQDRR